MSAGSSTTNRLAAERLVVATDSRRGLRKPATTVILAVIFGAALMGLAGWFIAASAVAGLAVASTFSFVYPSAGVQALAWARTLSRYGERITTHQATLDMVGSLRTTLFARALELPRDRVAELRSSELLGRIMVDSDAVENLLLRSWFPIIAAAGGLVGTVLMFAWLSPPLAIAGAVGLLLAGFVPMTMARYQAGSPARDLVDARARARRTLIEALDGLPELRSFGAEQRATGIIDGELRRFGDSRRRITRLETASRNGGTLLTDLTLVVIVAIATGAVVSATALSAPAFVAVCLVAIAVFELVVALPGAVTARARARAAAARLTDAFPTANTGVSRSTRAYPSTTVLQLRLARADGVLELTSGDTVLVRGASGTGKSTLLRAIGGHSASGTDIRFSGVDAGEIDPSALTRNVTLVAQDAHVFDGTIRKNLALADPSADESQLHRALAAVALDETVRGFPAGLDTVVGPGGSALSGGQRRRLSVAQGLLRHADVLLLDEPTEGLDTLTAAKLLAGVRAYDPGSVLIIALHDRQAPPLPWQVDADIELTGSWRAAAKLTPVK